MSREITFRAWDETANEMVINPVVSSFDWRKGSQEGSHATLMQYVGFPDKDGTPIFEGDILGYGKNSAPHLVQWNNVVGRWEWSKFPFSVTELRKLKVIGNIYENPELLSKDAS